MATLISVAGKRVNQLDAVTEATDSDSLALYDNETNAQKRITVSDFGKSSKAYASKAALKAATGLDVGTRARVRGEAEEFELTEGAPSEAAGDYQGVELTYAGSATKHWRRLYSGAINVKWFRAVGDGDTNDTASLLSLAAYVNALDDGDGVTINWGGKSNVYKITATIKFNNNNLRFIGQEARIHPVGDGFTESRVVYTNSYAANTWAATTEYLFGRVLKSGAEWYAVTSPGTSGSTAPTVTGGGSETLDGVTYLHLDPAECTFVNLSQAQHLAWVFDPAIWYADTNVAVDNVRTECNEMTSLFGTGQLFGAEASGSQSNGNYRRVRSTDAPWVDIAFVMPEQCNVDNANCDAVHTPGSHIGVLFVRPFQLGIRDARGKGCRRHGVYVDTGTNIELDRPEGLECDSHGLYLHNCDGLKVRMPDCEQVTISIADRQAGIYLKDCKQVTIERPFISGTHWPIIYDECIDVEILDPRILNSAAVAWAAGATKTVGSYVFANGQWYQCAVQGGGVTANKPSHTSGTVAEADGYSWTWIRACAYVINMAATDDRSANIRYRINDGLFDRGVDLDSVGLLGLVDPEARTLESNQTYPQPIIRSHPYRDILTMPFDYSMVTGDYTLRKTPTWRNYDIPKGARLVDCGIVITEPFAAASGVFYVRIGLHPKGTSRTSSWWAMESCTIYSGLSIHPIGPIDDDRIVGSVPTGRYGIFYGNGASLGTLLSNVLSPGPHLLPETLTAGIGTTNGLVNFIMPDKRFLSGDKVWAELPVAAGGHNLRTVFNTSEDRIYLDAQYASAINKSFTGVSDNGGAIQLTGMGTNSFEVGDWCNLEFSSVYDDVCAQITAKSTNDLIFGAVPYSATAAGTCRPAVRIISPGRIKGSTFLSNAYAYIHIDSTLGTATAGNGYVWLEYEYTGAQKAFYA